MGKNGKQRVIGLRLSGLILSIAACWGLLTQKESNATGSPDGFYLVVGGVEYIEIKETKRGLEMLPKLETLPERESSFIRGTPEGNLYVEFAFIDWNEPPRRIISGAYELAPSRESAGDWDLVGFFSPALDETATKAALFKVEPPVPSYYRRIDDRRCMELHNLLGEELVDANRPNRAEAMSESELSELKGKYLKLAEDLTRDHPDEPAVRFLFWRALFQYPQLDRLKNDLTEWRERCLGSPLPFVRQNFEYARDQLEARLAGEAGKNGWEVMSPVYAGQVSLEARGRIFSELLKHEEIRPWVPGIVGSPNLLGALTFAKTCDVLVTFALLEGKRDEALRMATGNYFIGQQMSQSGTLFLRMVGTAIRDYAIRGLAVYSFNACTESDDFERLWDHLNWLQSYGKAITDEDLLRFERALWLKSERSGSDAFQPNLIESMMRIKATEARWRNTLTGAAALAHFHLHGRFPTRPEEFSPWLPEIPIDPFTLENLRFYATDNKFVAYCAGPDGDDDMAGITYDPMNGTSSDGDIILEVPARAKYPFPREGLRARTVADVERVFPNGLPPDPFANNRGRGLSVTTDTTPVYIYSFGPDSDEWTGYPIRRPEVGYDPTNGVTSDGDLFISIPLPN